MMILKLFIILFNIVVPFFVLFLFLRKGGGARRAGGIIFLSSLLLIQYVIYVDAQYIEPNWIKMDKLVIKNGRFPDGLEKLKIALIADLHIKGYGFREWDMVRKVNALKPDVILIAGDFLSDRKYLPVLASILSKLDAKKGVYGVLGDNDIDAFGVSGIEEFKSVLESAGVHILDNSNVRIPVNGGANIRIIGIASCKPSKEAVMSAYSGVDMSDPKIVLSHYPENVDSGYFDPGNTDLLLAGGTHGGQVGIPLFVHLFYKDEEIKYLSGLFRVNGVNLYVNRGIATVGDTNVDTVRFLCRPEITVIRLSNKR